MAESYRVDLDIYNGPLDLLLYLIRRSELDIYDIPIATITEQYLAYMEAIQLLEPAVAGDFLVMAATLMEIKSRMLLPKAPAEEEALDDPRSELVRQLLEYKRFKDAAGWLGEQAEERAERVGRFGPEPLEPPVAAGEGDPEAPIADGPLEVSLWDLVEAFNRLMKATLANVPGTIVDEDVPIQTLSEYILERLKREGEVPFTALFEGRAGRRRVAGMFLAILELVRLRRIRAVQSERYGEILVRLRGPEVVPDEAPPEPEPVPERVQGPGFGAQDEGQDDLGDELEGLPPDGVEEDTEPDEPPAEDASAGP